jgi:hypothetical protein
MKHCSRARGPAALGVLLAAGLAIGSTPAPAQNSDFFNCAGNSVSRGFSFSCDEPIAAPPDGGRAFSLELGDLNAIVVSAKVAGFTCRVQPGAKNYLDCYGTAAAHQTVTGTVSVSTTPGCSQAHLTALNGARSNDGATKLMVCTSAASSPPPRNSKKRHHKAKCKKGRRTKTGCKK